MSDNDRKNPHETKQDHEYHDPLERLTRIFNPTKQSGEQNEHSFLHTNRSTSHSKTSSPSPSSHDDFDLSFLEEELENNLTHDLPFDDQKKQWNSHATSNATASDIAQTGSFNHSKQNNLSVEKYSSPTSHDEEQILDALSPLPIQKNQSPQQEKTTTSANPFFEKRNFISQSESENFFFDESERRENKREETEAVERANRFSQTISQQPETANTQKTYDDNQSFYDTSINHPYKISVDQENWSPKDHTPKDHMDVSSFREESEFFSSSNLVLERQNTERNQTTSDYSSPLDSPDVNRQSSLKGPSQEDHTTNYPYFLEESPSQQKTYNEEISRYNEAQTQYTNKAENVSNPSREVSHSQNNLEAFLSSSESLNIKQNNSFFAHNYTHRNTPPPNVDTYKFSEEIVEKTGPIMVPEVPYEAPEYDIPTGGLEEEFADVLNVGNVPKDNFSQKQQKNESFNEIFHQTMQSSKEGVYINSKEQNADYFSAANMEYNFPSLSENSPYTSSDEIPTHPPAPPPFKSSILGKTFIKGIFLLILIAVGFAGYSHFFMPSQKNDEMVIIHADNTPFKFKPETTETKNDIAHNLDVYKQTTGQNEKQENTQQFLIDNSEKPENLEGFSPEESSNISSSSSTKSDVEDAVTQAINHTIPTREVQTVIVNQDGTVTLAPMHQTENKPAAQSAETIDQISDKFQESSIISSHDSDRNDQESDLKNNIDKIIAANNSNASLEEKFIPIPSHAERNVNVETHAASRPTSPNKVAPQNSEGYYVQLASQPTHELARDSLKNMKSKFGFLIGTRPLNIQPAFIPGKGTYYRVRIQTQDRNEAISLCETIKNSGGNCFITR
ncbi:SPOR domain-containing protein [Bartonella tribocorum]|uniref:SPOR domain-containing protein n=1 Tax=Bartonella tribocorum TaxID=85701 RepID=A0A2M6UWH3_9HYPH|nr:SPOR domain-containing protein [Bartonella tribocorum]PIT70550.1 SPOR domain-containing protein [Bartonella tribocorum]